MQIFFVTLRPISNNTRVKMNFKDQPPLSSASRMPLGVAAAPVAALILGLILIIIFRGADAIADLSPIALLMASLLAMVITSVRRETTCRGMKVGFTRSARQILPAVPMLVCIAMVATTWMMSGVVPTFIVYGLKVLNPTFFLVTACVVCALISIFTGSSWSTIATIGVAFMGIGEVMGYSDAWIAGAVISGAYFGDKVSPLSDTTVVASSAVGVDLFTHMRYLMLTSVPALLCALAVYAVKGLLTAAPSGVAESALIADLQSSFHITPWLFAVPVITLSLIVMRVPTLITLASSALLGFIALLIYQPDLGLKVSEALGCIVSGFGMNTSSATINELASTGGILGMMPTIFLVLAAMTFGSVMIGTGMLGVITHAITSRLKKRTSIVSATVASGLFMNSCTADQYLSLIITGNMYRNAYRRFGLEPRLLSRTIEDGVSVTSVLIPWNSCGLTQSMVLGVPTMVYFPFCVFNILSPCFSILLAWTGWKIPTWKAPALNSEMEASHT